MNLTIRADATEAIGAGHAMRCANLARAWVRAGHGKAQLNGEISIAFVADHYRALGIREAGDVLPGAVLVVDTYDPEERWRQASRPEVRLRVLVDDVGGPVPLGYDAVWNPNAYGDASLYPRFRGTVLSGRDHVPVREDLPLWSGEEADVIAIMLGGGRPSQALVDCAVRFGERVGAGRVRAVGSWAPPTWDRVSPVDPWPAVARASALVTASGSTVWEAARVGIPIVPVCTAHNQRLIWDWACAQGAAGVDLSAYGAATESCAEALLSALSRARRLPPIGNGAPTVARALADLARKAGDGS